MFLFADLTNGSISNGSTISGPAVTPCAIKAPIVVLIVGEPHRGKSLAAHKIARNLKWKGEAPNGEFFYSFLNNLNSWKFLGNFKRSREELRILEIFSKSSRTSNNLEILKKSLKILLLKSILEILYLVFAVEESASSETLKDVSEWFKKGSNVAVSIETFLSFIIKFRIYSFDQMI